MADKVPEVLLGATGFPVRTISVSNGDPTLYLVTLDRAKRHLQIDYSSDDKTIKEMVAGASDIVLDYLKKDLTSSTFDWCDDLGEPKNCPKVVQQAVLLVVGALYENRDGDAWRSPQPLSQAVMDLLERKRDPAMA